MLLEAGQEVAMAQLQAVASAFMSALLLVTENGACARQLQRDPMTEAEIEDLVLKLNQIEVS
jgi:hypothetical protein